MKLPIALSLSMVLAILQGCADAPTTNDAKQAIQDLIGNCKYLTVANVMKVNFPLDASEDYQVDIQYSIKSTPLPDAAKIAGGLQSTLAEFDTRFKAALLERDDDYDANKELLEKISQAKQNGNGALAETYQNQRTQFMTEKLDPSLEKVRDMSTEKARLIKQGTGALHHEFLDACPKTDAMFYQRFFDNSDLALYIQDTTKDFATSVRMAKKDQHWSVKE